MLTRTMHTTTPFNSLRREMDRLFDSMLESGAPRFRPAGDCSIAFPALNIWQDGQSVYAEAELPGVSMDDIELLATGDTLTLKAQRTISRPEKSNVIRNERISGAFERTVTLPVEIDVEAVEATLEHGVLTVAMPKAQSVLPRRINVRTALPSGDNA